MPIFFILLLIIYLGGNIYVFLRGRQALKTQSTGVKVLLSVLFWGCAFLFFGSFLSRNIELPAAFAQTCQEIGTGWLVFTLYMVMLLAAFDLLKLFNIRCKQAFFLSSALTLSLLSYGYYHYRHPKTKVINIVINKPSFQTDGAPLRIVAVSDVHLGYATDKDMLKEYVRMINAQRPDLVLIGGDLIDNSIVPVRAAHMEEELNQLIAPLGIYMVPGNHEYFSDMEGCSDFIKQTQIHLLRDSIVSLPGGIQLLGREDRSNRQRKSLEELMEHADPDKVVVLLDHQPYNLEATVTNRIDLQFSGHTHRGQVWPLNLITDHLFELSYGYRKVGNSHLYVSSGLSLWGPPFRIGTDSELVVFNITSK